jgi:catechol 2,3-dioxygenase-like lactoylglutathione lyase family enzyme
MINGAHVIFYSKDPESDRAFFRDVLEFPAVDAGHGWLIFPLPPAEAAFHPAEKDEVHELFFMCDDLKATMESLKVKKVKCGSVKEERWGTLNHDLSPRRRQDRPLPAEASDCNRPLKLHGEFAR